MISFKNVSKYCCEDISLIENYEKAIADKNKLWVCHHRLEIDLDLSWKELIALGMYYNRPASELIFLTKAEHRKVHQTGRRRSPEIVEKIRKANTGKHRTQETKNKMSKSHKGKHLTDEHKAKIGCANTGKHHTEEAKAKNREAHKGKHPSAETRAKISNATSGENNPKAIAVYQIDKTTNKIIKKWKFLNDAAKTLKINHGNIVGCCKGLRKSAGGFKWKYAE